VGVLTLYSSTHTTVDPVPERLTAVKDLLSAALNGYCAAHPHEDHTIRLHRALYDRQLLERAIGILMTRHQVSQDLARQLLTQHSADEHVRPSTAARAVIRQHLSAGDAAP
jgi:AmiR/NasT family two-component response regulator